MKVLTWEVDLGDTEVMKERNILQPLLNLWFKGEPRDKQQLQTGQIWGCESLRRAPGRVRGGAFKMGTRVGRF